MKYLKTYEELNNSSEYPEVGDYVIVDSDRDVLKNRTHQIAKIIRINDNMMLTYRYEIRYDDGEEIYIGANEFAFCSDDKDELEAVLQSNKYNL